MPIEIAARVAFLKKTHLFDGLEDDELEEIAENFFEAHYPAGSIIFEQHSKAESFYLIYRGRVRLTRGKHWNTSQVAVRKNYSYFGEADLIPSRRRSATAAALTDTILLVLSRKDFNQVDDIIFRLKLKRLTKFIIMDIPQITGRFVLDVIGRDKASVTSAGILGWLIIIVFLLLLTGFLRLDVLVNIWRFLIGESN